MVNNINEEAVQKILGASTRANFFLTSFDFYKNPYEILDIILVAILFYWVYLLLKETRAMSILYGIVMLAIVMLVGKLLQLQVLNFILTYVLAGLVVAIPVVFQPELRSALEKLGRTKFVGDFGKLKKAKLEAVVNEIVSAVEYLAREKQGGIIVFTRQTGLRDIVQTGVVMNAEISKQLLVNIFTPKSPLHDGAVIISGDKVVAANCWLPLPEQEFNFDLGTRHRAAAGISAETDAIVVVISEETGRVSLADNGNLTVNLSRYQLTNFLVQLLQHKIEGVSV